jgi:hypothetical protein
MKKASGQPTKVLCVSGFVIWLILVSQACSSKPRSGGISQPSSAPVTSNPSRAAPGKRPYRFPASAGTSSDEDELEASLKRLRAGNLAYSTPQKMKTGQTAQVTARIATVSVPTSQLTRVLAGEQTNVITSVKVSTKMR